MEDDYEITDEELFADIEIPESDWQLDGPLNLPTTSGAQAYDIPGDMSEVYELDGDEDVDRSWTGPNGTRVTKAEHFGQWAS